MERKLDIGSVFERVFAIYRDQFTLLIPAALLLFIPVAILNGLVLSAGGVLASLLVAAIGAVATYWYQGMVVTAAEDILDGRRDHTVGSLFGSTTEVIAPLFGAGLLAGIATGIGFLLLIVPGLYLLTIWAVIAPVIVLERAGVFESFGRSRQLVKGNGWQVFGVIAILFLASMVVGIFVRVLLGNSFALLALSDLIVHVLVVPVSGLAAAVMYFGLKAAREGDGSVLPPPTPAGGGPESIPTTPPPTPAPGGPPPQAPPVSDLPGGAQPPQAPPVSDAPGGAQPPPQTPPPGNLPGGTPPPTGGPQAPAG